jgi:DNA-binding transcriptional ArsR family regulator
MSLVEIYQCLCDPTRLRILNLLNQGPLCVCHFQEILGEPQVKISKHLGYLKTHGMVEARREANWMVYQLPAKPTRELKANLSCLQDCAQEDPIFRRDAERLRKSRDDFAASSPICCRPTTKKKAKATHS